MPSKSPSSKSSVKKPAKVVKPVKSAKTKVATRKVSSRQAAAVQQRNQRTKFVAGVALAAAALVAISLGLMSYNRPDSSIARSSVTQPSDGKGVLYLQSVRPSKLTAGTTISVSLYENSGAQPVNTVQSAVQYPADKVQIVGVKTASAFPQEAATDTKTPGLVRIARSVTTQAAPQKGAKPIAVIEFKLLQDASAPLNFGIDNGSSLLVRSTDNQNILQ